MTPRHHIGMGDTVSKYATLGIAGLGDVPCYPAGFQGPLPTGASYCPSGTTSSIQTTTLSGPVCLDDSGNIIDCGSVGVAYQFNVPSSSSTVPTTSTVPFSGEWLPGIPNTTLILGVGVLFAIVMLIPGGRR